MIIGPFNIPYRWTWRTFFPNIKSMCEDLYYGVRNVIRWTPVIWHDVDLDWCPLARVMEYKMRRMAKHHMDRKVIADYEEVAKQLLICAELLKRLQEDEIDLQRIKLHNGKMKYYQEYLGKMIGKHLMSWWD